MPSFLRYILVFCVVASWCAGSRGQRAEPSFPNDDEIKLVVTQAERAVQQYKPMLDTEAKVLDEKGKDVVAKDRQVVLAIETGNKAFNHNPQAFNGPLGFAYFEWLHVGSRNAVLCAANASLEVSASIRAGEKDKAELEMQLSQNCMDVSTLLYTVSKNVGALYARYTESEENLANKGFRVATECAEALKKKATPKQ